MIRSGIFVLLLLLGTSHAFVGPLKTSVSTRRYQSTKVEDVSLKKFGVEITPEVEEPNLKSLQVRQQSISGNGEEIVLGEDDEENNWLSGALWRGSIVVLCALWASNFPVAKMIMGEPDVDSGLYALTRFSAAALALMPGTIASVRKGNIDWETAKGAAICGSWVAFGYLGQTLGLLMTTASKSCVICSMHCVFVAGLAEYYRTSSNGSKFNISKLIPAVVAVLGVAIIELKGAGGAPNAGDLLSFAQPIGFGLGYVQLEHLMQKKPEAALPVSAIKLFVVAFASLGMYEFLPLVSSTASDFAIRVPDITPILSSQTALAGILYTGLVTTALALWFESIAFKRVPATDASIILATEPIFAAATAAAFLGETFGASDYIGASIIVGACVLAILQEDKPSEDVYDAVVTEKLP